MTTTENKIVLRIPKDSILFLSKISALGIWLYWFIYALVAPVTLWDSHVYNIARVKIADIAGIFNNPFWNSTRQVEMPWGFDVLHLIFVKIQFGYDLPSFACFTGLSLIMFEIIKDEVSIEAAWSSVLMLMTMPCLMYQATSTKPDIGVLFTLSCWYYSVLKYRKNNDTGYVILMALALSLGSGMKQTGLMHLPITGLVSLYILRKDYHNLKLFLISFFILFILYSNFEVYFINYKYFGNYLGNPDDIKMSANMDGLKGACATFIRRLFENSGFEYIFYKSADSFFNFWSYVCVQTLNILRLRDLGYCLSNDIKFSDSNLRFISNGQEASTDFGLLAGISIWFSLFTVLKSFFVKTYGRILSISALGSLFLFSYFSTYGPYSNRYCLIPFTISSIALIKLVYTHCNDKTKYCFSILLCLAAIIPPLISYNKKPSDILRSIYDRSDMELAENYRLYPVFANLKELSKKGELKVLGVCTSGDGWIFPFYDILPNIKIVLLSDYIIPSKYSEINYSIKNLNKCDYIISLDRSLPIIFSKKWKPVYSYVGSGGFGLNGSNTILYKRIQ